MSENYGHISHNFHRKTLFLLQITHFLHIICDTQYFPQVYLLWNFYFELISKSISGLLGPAKKTNSNHNFCSTPRGGVWKEREDILNSQRPRCICFTVCFSFHLNQQQKRPAIQFCCCRNSRRVSKRQMINVRIDFQDNEGYLYIYLKLRVYIWR